MTPNHEQTRSVHTTAGPGTTASAMRSGSGGQTMPAVTLRNVAGIDVVPGSAATF